MSNSRIHPTAVISPEAELADDVVVGPMVCIEGRVKVGAGSVLRPRCHLIGPLTMGANNQVFPGAILGERPQHTKYNDEPTTTEIGDNNVFRENVTVHRGTSCNWTTRVGSNNFFMAGSHIAHDCTVGSRCIFANNALVGGHAIIEDFVYLSGNTAVHQFCRIGRFALLSGCSATTKDMPPFIVQQGHDNVVGVNIVGMRRGGISSAEIGMVRRAFRYLYRECMVLPAAMARIEQEMPASPAVAELLAFIRKSARGVNQMKGRYHDRDAA